MLSPSTIAHNWQQLQHQAPSPLAPLQHPLLQERKVHLWIKRDDQLVLPTPDGDRSFCGNKWRKMKYNLLQAQATPTVPLLTFGGAYSNHIAAVASAGLLFGLPTIGIIRGERPANLNPTLLKAQAHGMRLHFISRTAYRKKQDPNFVKELEDTFGPCFTIPEGGTNAFALQGVAELAHELQHQCTEKPDQICCCCGTGGTLAGLIIGMQGKSQLIGYPALKGDFMETEVKAHLRNVHAPPLNWHIQGDYHFGGYAKHQPKLIEFIHWFKARFNIALDPIYTGKLCFGIWDQIEKGHYPPDTHLLLIHSGGLQGIEGFNQRFGTTLPLH